MNRIKKINLFFPGFLLLIQTAIPVFAQTGSFARGADVSWVSQMVSQGIPFYNTSGVQQNLFQVLQGNCINAIRLRVWVNPAAPGWNGQTDVVNKAVEAAAAGYRILIDFHYSDTWADPGDQNKPAAWANYTFAQLQQAVSMHTNSVLSALAAAGVTPEWVQVGNETNNGMLWPVNPGDPSGEVAINGVNNFTPFAELINSGYAAVKAVFPNAKVIIHISNGYDNALFEWMFDGLKAAGANWDVIGMSLYPSTTDYTTLDAECLANMQDMVTRYGKPVMNCEVGMDVTDPTDSEAFLKDIISKNSSLGSMGLGVFYWEPESYNNWQGYGLGAFGTNGEPTAAMNAFGTGCAVQTPTFTNTANVTATYTPTNTSTNTPTNTDTRTPTNTPTNTATRTATNTPSNTPTRTATNTVTNTTTSTTTNTPTRTVTNTPTNTAALTATNTPNNTSTPTTTNTPTNTTTSTASLTATNSPTNSQTNTATSTASASSTNTATNSPTATLTHTSTNTPTNTATSTSTSVLTSTSTNTATKTATNTPTNSSTATATNTPTNTETGTATLTATHSPANTATNTLTATSTNTKINTPTLIPTNTATSTSTNTLTPQPTSTRTDTPTITETFTPTQSSKIVISDPFPNPSNGSPVTFNVQVQGASTAVLDVFTLSFRKIFSETGQVNGSQTLQWDLKDMSGIQAANGVYYVRIHVTGNSPATEILKVMILR